MGFSWPPILQSTRVPIQNMTRTNCTRTLKKTTNVLIYLIYLYFIWPWERTRYGNRNCQTPRPVSGGSLPPTDFPTTALQTLYSRRLLQMEKREEKKNLKREEKDTEGEGERNGKQPKPLLFRHCPHPIPHRTHALFNPPPRFFLPSPSSDPAPVCRLRPPPKLQPFPRFTWRLRPGSVQENNGFLLSWRCWLLRVCCCSGFCPLLGVPFVPAPFLKSAPPWGCVVRFGFRRFGCCLSLDLEGSVLGWGKFPPERRRICCALMASCEESAMQ